MTELIRLDALREAMDEYIVGTVAEVIIQRAVEQGGMVTIGVDIANGMDFKACGPLPDGIGEAADTEVASTDAPPPADCGGCRYDQAPNQGGAATNSIKKYQTILPYAIAVDFDGCLCEDRYPEIGQPHPRVLNRLRVAQGQGKRLILWTCREGRLLEEAVEWCHQQGLRFAAINDNLPERVALYSNNCRKVSADEYLDDKAWRTDG
ncbi:MAG: hypothetical protein RSE23_01720 [Clostridia bacterium]